jgi:hypothetical protein
MLYFHNRAQKPYIKNFFLSMKDKTTYTHAYSHEQSYNKSEQTNSQLLLLGASSVSFTFYSSLSAFQSLAQV